MLEPRPIDPQGMTIVARVSLDATQQLLENKQSVLSSLKQIRNKEQQATWSPNELEWCSRQLSEVTSSESSSEDFKVTRETQEEGQPSSALSSSDLGDSASASSQGSLNPARLCPKSAQWHQRYQQLSDFRERFNHCKLQRSVEIHRAHLPFSLGETTKGTL